MTLCHCGKEKTRFGCEAAPSAIYYGHRENMIAEVAAQNYMREKYLLQFWDEAGHAWDTEGVNTKKDLREVLDMYRAQYPGIEVRYVG